MTPELPFVALGAAVAAGAAFFFIGRWVGRRLAQRVRQSAQEIADRLLADARRDAEAFRQTVLSSGNEELARARTAQEGDFTRRREELSKSERRLEEQGRQLDRKV